MTNSKLKNHNIFRKTNKPIFFYKHAMFKNVTLKNTKHTNLNNYIP